MHDLTTYQAFLEIHSTPVLVKLCNVEDVEKLCSLSGAYFEMKLQEELLIISITLTLPILYKLQELVVLL